MRPVFHSQCPRARLRRRVQPSCQVVRTRDFRLIGTRVLDLSATGMLLETELPILTGEEVIVSFKSPADDRWFDCEANVARVLHGRRRADAGRALGIAFDTIDPWNQLLLCEHLRNAPLARDHAAIARA
ncbi:MAG TPA: PilZ domain-containing protein [Polyangiaceae bacterium]|nr:PilZ domain-containing protein [Polyangiaceae bacterium]